MRVNRSFKKQQLVMRLFTTILYLCLTESGAFEILQHGGRLEEGQHAPFTETIRVEEGSSFLLRCQTDDFINSCTWSHKGHTCHLKYSSTAKSLVKNICDDLETRVDVRGNYDNHECGLLIRKAKLEDSGLWGCYVKEYISALAFFKEAERKTALTRVQVVPKSKQTMGILGRASFCDCDCNQK